MKIVTNLYFFFVACRKFFIGGAMLLLIKMRTPNFSPLCGHAFGTLRVYYYLYFFRFLIAQYTKGNVSTAQIQMSIESTDALVQAIVGQLGKEFERLIHSLPEKEIANNKNVTSIRDSLNMSAGMFNDVSTEYRRAKHLVGLGLILPISVKIGMRENVKKDGFKKQIPVYAQYVSIIDTLKSVYLGRKPTYLTHPHPTTLAQFEDTRTYKTRHQNAPPTLRLILYHDDIELANPLGSRAGVHKLTMFYFSVHGYLTGNLRDIHLALVCYASDIKTHGYKQVLKPLIDDLNELKAGVVVEGRDRLFFAELQHVVGDNLAANQILGMVCSFNNTRYCRFCYTSGADASTCPTSRGELKRSAVSHHVDVETVQHQAHFYKHTGVKEPCALDEVHGFSSIESTVPDIMYVLNK